MTEKKVNWMLGTHLYHSSYFGYIVKLQEEKDERTNFQLPCHNPHPK